MRCARGPELVLAALMYLAPVSAPLPGTLGDSAHTTRRLGRLFAEALENAPTHPPKATA